MRRHDFDALSFAFGLLFAAAGLVLLATTTIPQRLSIPWAGPLLAIGIAILIVVAAPRPERGAGASDEALGDLPGDGPLG